ncbi:MAG TPA: DUF6325 family protein [Miltoncostaeaceae bacterium]|nr:DUF6325 family protein [Miltoncostaeaceae bacterium]
MSTDDLDELGPIDVVVIGYPADAPMTGEAVPILVDLVDRGIVRVLDVLFVTKGEDGAFAGFTVDGIDKDRIGDFTIFEGASSGLLGDEDAESAAAAMEPGESAVVLVYENRWAAPFAAAVRRNGGQLIASQRIPVQDVVEALEALED